jgi:hypothetical protein
MSVWIEQAPLPAAALLLIIGDIHGGAAAVGAPFWPRGVVWSYADRIRADVLAALTSRPL